MRKPPTYWSTVDDDADCASRIDASGCNLWRIRSNVGVGVTASATRLALIISLRRSMGSTPVATQCAILCRQLTRQSKVDTGDRPQPHVAHLAARKLVTENPRLRLTCPPLLISVFRYRLPPSAISPAFLDFKLLTFNRPILPRAIFVPHIPAHVHFSIMRDAGGRYRKL